METLTRKTAAKTRRYVPSWLAPVGISTLAWALLAVPHMFGLFQTLDLSLLDSKFQIRGEREADPRIAIIGIDDATVRAFDTWPIPRDTYAPLIHTLLQSGANSIGMDVRLPQDPAQSNDEALADLSRRSDRVVQILWTPIDPAETPAPPDAVEETWLRFGVPCASGEAFEAKPIEVPYPELLQSMRRAGHIMVTRDPDGAIRRVMPFVGRGGTCVPALAITLLGASRGDSLAGMSGSPNRIAIRWTSGAVNTLPVDRDRSTGLDFTGGPTAFPNTYSMTQVLHWTQESQRDSLRAAFAGKIILIGLTSQQEASPDDGVTPFDASMPLVYIHANFLDNLLRGRFLTRPGSFGYLVFMLLLSLAVARAIHLRGHRIAGLIAGLATIVVIVAVQMALGLWAIEIPTIASAALVPLVFGLTASYRVLFLERIESAVKDIVPEALVGKQIGNYWIESRIGVGGMGHVFRGVAVHSGRIVAVKFLPGLSKAPEDARRRFRHEAMALARVSHPNVARLIDQGPRDGIDFIVMEYVRGMSLAERITEGRVPEDEALAIGKQICAGIAAAHKRGVLHRDLKPSNIMLTGLDQIKIVDFGLARLVEADPSSPTITALTTPGQVMGTPPYMAPEMTRGLSADARTDVYGIGIVLFEMVTGRWPYPPCAPEDIRRTIQNELPRSPAELGATISQRFQAVILRCLSKDPDDRPARTIELGIELAQLSQHKVRA